MKIVSYKESHLAEVNAIEQSRQPFPWPIADLERALYFPYKTLVCEINNEVAGFAVFYWLASSADLMNIAVAEKYLRQGVARKLIERAIAAAEQANLVNLLLEVRASNAPAIALYEQLDFFEIDLRRGYYPMLGSNKKREDAIVMCKNLTTDMSNFI